MVTPPLVLNLNLGDLGGYISIPVAELPQWSAAQLAAWSWVDNVQGAELQHVAGVIRATIQQLARDLENVKQNLSTIVDQASADAAAAAIAELFSTQGLFTTSTPRGLLVHSLAKVEPQEATAATAHFLRIALHPTTPQTRRGLLKAFALDERLGASAFVDEPKDDLTTSRCPQQWKIDTNDRYQRAVSIVLSLSTAALVLPILYFRDILVLKDSQVVDALRHSRLIQVGWLSLGLSVAAGIVYLFFSAKWVKLAWNKPADFFSLPLGTRRVELALDWSYFGMMVAFLVGVFCLVLFMATFQPPVEWGQRHSRALELLPDPPRRIGPFADGLAHSTELESTARAIAEGLCDEMRKRRLATLIVVGSADRRRLSQRLKGVFASNAGLARARAQRVSNWLQEGTCGRVPSVVVASPGPTIEAVTAEELEADRYVHVVAVWADPASNR